MNQSLPDTDPTRGAYNVLAAPRVIYYEPPGQTVAAATARSNQARTPLTSAAQPCRRTAPGDSDGDGDVDSADSAAFRGA